MRFAAMRTCAAFTHRTPEPKTLGMIILIEKNQTSIGMDRRRNRKKWTKINRQYSYNCRRKEEKNRKKIK